MKKNLFSLGLLAITTFCGQTQHLPASENITIHTVTSSRKSTVSKPPKGGLTGLAKQTVSTCHYKHQYHYHAKARSALSEYSPSTAQLIVIPLAENFAGTIITELETTAKTLSFSDRQVFWRNSGEEIKKLLQTFCNEHGVTSTEGLNQKIDNVIQMKVRFG